MIGLHSSLETIKSQTGKANLLEKVSIENLSRALYTLAASNNVAQYNRSQNRRQTRPAFDHDIYEGLPVRHWRRDYVTVVPPPALDTTSSSNDIWAVELPHGMPKDSHMLPQHSQDLLRAARSGRIYKRPTPAEEEEVETEVQGEKVEKKDDEMKDKGFTAKAWKQIPRHMEGPDVEYLAKRRKGLITVSAKPAAAVPTVTKATVKRIDAAGNEYVQNVVVQSGQKIEGEVISQTVVPDPAVVVGDAAPLPIPPKRQPKRKSKGPGRGKKKQKLGPPPNIPQVLDANGVPQPAPVADGPDVSYLCILWSYILIWTRVLSKKMSLARSR